MGSGIDGSTHDVPASCASDDQHGTGRRTYDVMRRRAEQEHIHGSSPMHAHHDQIGTQVGGLTKDFPIRAALDDRRFHRAVGLRLCRESARADDGAPRRPRPREVRAKSMSSGRRFWTDHRRRLDDMKEREMRVGFLGHVDGVRERAE